MELLRRIVPAGLAVLGLAFAIDLIRLLSGETARVILPNGATQSTADVVISHVDRARHRIRADITVEIRQTPALHNLAVAFADGRQLFAPKPLTGGGFDEKTGRTFSRARHRFANVELPIEAAGPELLYPFDRVRFPFAIEACANVAPGKTCKSARVQVVPHTTVSLGDTVANRYVIVTRSGDRLALRRQHFVMLLTLYFAIVATAFLHFLHHIEGEAKLATNALGTLAALWGFRDLLVPKSVDAYPTLIDYFVMLAFSIVFVIVIRRFNRKETPHAQI